MININILFTSINRPGKLLSTDESTWDIAVKNVFCMLIRRDSWYRPLK